MPSRKKSVVDIEQVAYRPTGSYPLDLEIFSASSLRRRADKAHLRRTHRYDFHMLVMITSGQCTPWVDFEPIACEAGSVLTIRPFQTHRFGLEEDWDGLILLFRPDFLVSSQQPPEGSVSSQSLGLERLDVHRLLPVPERRTVEEAILRMKMDAATDVPAPELHALLRHQLYALLLRLRILENLHSGRKAVSSSAVRQFKLFQQQVETNLSRFHQVTDYADLLGCSERSLTRSSLEVAGLTAKAFIASCINLEAKRWLAHSDLSVARIAERLGFEEASYFVKFFRRQAGCTPGEFRRVHGEVTD